jgi:RNA polymerase sigma-70 factor (ECF subfamily)
LGLGAAQDADLRQRLREQLLVRGPGKRPQLEEYGGRGELMAWLGVVALREGLRLLKRERRPPLAPEAWVDALGPTEDPELLHFKRTYRAEFGLALANAMRTLTARQRNLLRQHFLEELTIDQIAAMYGIHRSSAARWVAKARHALVTQVRRDLLARLGLGKRDLDSIVRLLKNRLEVSLRGFGDSEG